LAQDDIEQIWKVLENEPGTEVTVDLEHREVRCADIVAPMGIDDYTRWRLMEGLDDIGLTMRHVDAIADFETARPSHKPRTLACPGDTPGISLLSLCAAPGLPSVWITTAGPRAS